MGRLEASFGVAECVRPQTQKLVRIYSFKGCSNTIIETPYSAFSSAPAQCRSKMNQLRAEISSMRSMGSLARSRMCFGNSIRGARFFMQSRTFSSVFIFMYLHSLQ